MEYRKFIVAGFLIFLGLISFAFAEDYSLQHFLTRVTSKPVALSKKEKVELLNQIERLLEKALQVHGKVTRDIQTGEIDIRYQEGDFWISKLKEDRKSIEAGMEQVKLLKEKPGHLVGSVRLYKSLKDLSVNFNAYNNMPSFSAFVGDLAPELELWADPVFFQLYLLPLARIKDVEKEIVEDLKNRGLLYKTEKYVHDYPFCWRCDTPLIYYARDSWYFAMSKLKDELIKNNSKINWVPKHIKEGRFGEWLREVKDWAISRERYWGTPIPVWTCEQCKEIKVIGSRKELGLDEKFDLHRPFIDEIKLKCKCGAEMRRIPEVMDCWFDSGAMPFAQNHYPFENKNFIDKGKKYPAEFIAEAIDQTRGWFYTLLAISTMLNKGASYKNVICLGHILDKDGQKMSKHIGNVIDPWEMIEKYGADVLRWYLYTVNQPGEPKRFDENSLKEFGRMFNTLLNVVSFYKLFSGKKVEDLKKSDLTNILDKWIISKLNQLIKYTTEKLDNYDITTAARNIEDFINDLSVWYVRRSRDRFKNNDEKAMKTLGHVIFNLIKLVAPFIPFTTEHIYQELGGEDSVHLRDWPKVEKKLIDEKLEEEMTKVREICSLALQKRAEANLKVRQPLGKLRVKSQKLKVEFADLIKDEANVKEVIFEPELRNQIELDITITKELKEEGIVRDFIRNIQARRKEMGLTPKDEIKVYYSENKEIVEKYTDQIKKQVIAKDIVFVEGELKIEKI